MKLFQLSENVSLNNHQRYVLLQLSLAGTPTVGYDQINRNESDIQAREILDRIGLIRVSEEEKVAELTQAGEKAVVEYGLVDDTGTPTEVGEELLKNAEEG